MNKIVFTEEFCGPEKLFPFTLTRQIQDIRVGVFTIREKWEQQLDMPSFDKQEGDYKDLHRAMVIDEGIGNDIIFLIHGNVLPTAPLVKAVKRLKPGEFISLPQKDAVVYCLSKKQVIDENRLRVEKGLTLAVDTPSIKYPWNLFEINAWAISQDVAFIRKTRKSQKIPASNRVTNGEAVFVEKGASVEHCIINAAYGPIYIGKGATVMEGCLLRGPVAICAGATVKMGAKIYGATTIGPHCIVGGEIKNSILFGHANKAHDGYLGDSVIGEWCNLGAGTSNSNIKNTASPVSVYTPEGLVTVGPKCGVIMGDYSRTAINTSINTGTLIGVCCNVFGNGLTPKYIPSFSWGAEGVRRYEFDKALVDINAWKTLKKEELTPNETSILSHISEHY